MADNQETPAETIETETIVIAQAEEAAPATAPGVTVTTVVAQPGEFLTPIVIIGITDITCTVRVSVSLVGVRR